MAEERIERVKCANCDYSLPKKVAIERDGKSYCCKDCLEGKGCKCQ